MTTATPILLTERVKAIRQLINFEIQAKKKRLTPRQANIHLSAVSTYQFSLLLLMEKSPKVKKARGNVAINSNIVYETIYNAPCRRQIRSNVRNKKYTKTKTKTKKYI